MIDIHTHIMPGVDDGAGTLEDALRLIRQAVEGGTREIILTPHCAPSYGFFNFNDYLLEEKFDVLCRAVEKEQIPVVLHPGMEVLYESKEEFLIHIDEYFPLCGGRYFLMEFFFDASGENLLEGIQTVKEQGYIPVIAHPERYECVKKDWELALEGCKKGAKFQINKSSLSGTHGEKAARCATCLLDMDLVDFIASDAHHVWERGSGLGRVCRFIEKEYGTERAKKLFVTNPRKVVGRRK
ncbi:tyrosine-protein phosphatase [Sellimonas sp.]|uniref:tyrosine-protein phosphatase n=1 Tax=Sellimonas sp. TaxID=2021466 RepID=UPI0025794E88|nr:CpsB/CapC family capsule biosynthesis tyrosine phosphatase [Sellimonas sp.]